MPVRAKPRLPVGINVGAGLEVGASRVEPQNVDLEIERVRDAEERRLLDLRCRVRLDYQVHRPVRGQREQHSLHFSREPARSQNLA